MHTFRCSIADGLSALSKYSAAIQDAALLEYPAVVHQPLLRGCSPQHRATRLDSSLATIGDLQAKISLLDEIQQSLSAAQAAIQTYCDAITQALAPVFGLPVEILREIFILAVYAHEESSKFRRIDVATSISHVCSWWRGIACSSSELWQDILVTPLDSAELFEAWTSRALLRRPENGVTMTLVPPHRPSSSARVSLAKATLDATGHFVLSFKHDALEGSFLGSLPLWRAWPALRGFRRVTIESAVDASAGEVDHLDDDFLQDFEIDPFDAPFPDIENLELVNQSLRRVSSPHTSQSPAIVKTLHCRQSSVQEVVWACFNTHLEELRLSECYDDEGYIDDGGPYIFPKLSTLAIHDCDERIIVNALKNTRAPALECLDFRFPGEINITSSDAVWSFFPHLVSGP